MRRIGVVSAGAFICAFASQALAGPDWNEGGSDAGSTLGSQRTVSRSGGGAMSSVGGATSAGVLVADQHDLIEIYISDPASFFFYIPFIHSPWDSRIFLFRGEGHGTGNPVGEPLLMNDNSELDGYIGYQASIGNLTGEMTTMLNGIGESFLPGRYLLAICGNTSVPIYQSGSFWVPLFDTPFLGFGLRTNSAASWAWNAPTTTTSGSWRYNAGGVLALPPENCNDAEVVTGFVSRPIDNTLALESSSFPDTCGLSRDVWYRLAVNCSSTIRVSTCGTVDFDSVIEVYTGDCASAVFVGCDNDGCGAAGSGSSVEFPGDSATSGEYLIRVGSRCGSPGGIGTIQFECRNPNDINGDGAVDGIDLAQLLTDWTG